ncbi:MAG: hypothetical protein NVSMB65_12000 [Chloroflexota bacterium]
MVQGYRLVRRAAGAAVLLVLAVMAGAGLHAPSAVPVGVAAAVLGSHARAGQSASMPPGPAATILTNGCQICHSLAMITQQHLSSTAWKKELTKMQGWGAPVTERQDALIVPYLARYFGPRTGSQPARLVPAPTAAESTVGTPSRWMSVDTARQRVHLIIVAAYDATLGGFNFNGHGNGTLVVSIPVGWGVEVTFSNHSAVPHSALVTPYAQRNRVTGFMVAFPGASSPHPTAGITTGAEQRFHFTAVRAGRYALVCAVPGHEQAGMWDTFVVSVGGSPRLTP